MQNNKKKTNQQSNIEKVWKLTVKCLVIRKGYLVKREEKEKEKHTKFVINKIGTNQKK